MGADEPVTATMCIKRFLQVYPKTRNAFCASLHCIVFSFHSGKLLITIVGENKSNPFPFLATFCRLYLTQTYLLLTLLLCCTGSCIIFVLQLIDTDTLRAFCIAPSFPPNLLSPFPDLPSLALIVTPTLASVFSPFSLECHTNTNTAQLIESTETKKYLYLSGAARAPPSLSLAPPDTSLHSPLCKIICDC